MDKVQYYEYYSLCCNPFGLDGHKSVRTNLRSISHGFMTKFHSNGVRWITENMKICMNCMIMINQKAPVTDLAEGMVFEEQVSPLSSLASSKETPSSGESVGSTYNIQKIQELAKFLEISFQVKSSRLDASSSNYRNATMDEMFNQILSKIKTWFPPNIVDVTEDFNSVLLNLNSAVSKAEPEKQIELLKLLPRNWSYAKVKAHFDVSQHVITESKKYNLGIQPLSKVGRPSHGSDVQDKVSNFYLRDDISRPFPGLKDTISVKLPNGVC